ncbi:hypothetical protein BU24DRAFT_497048 [Aaosphaeria arxii CBS 175.79]|uniref:SAP domain-containing protein n=1 Tax=Aaosphaeria arxii CBS 175.79 TaxID=1450172 RepID=A0A6A5X903_9PLEO|nr:uncharacterized protein BU24DRAFT_497048 [Aaosphaeria arxii CBS 175.79]KAF2009403.1 hypothetical protein BU24DRAFT_497048 [Aaosphaeria arxii CBS 175.79]
MVKELVAYVFSLTYDRDYSSRQKWQLHKILEERTIPFENSSRKQELVDLLEEDDLKKRKQLKIENHTPNKKPRLRTPDIEYNYDRSKLRDQRATPGRVKRPRYEDMNIPDDVLGYFELNFTIPKEEKPKGRTNARQENELFKRNALLNPLTTFHDLYRCHEKGRQGSPTYDGAGYQLDWEKVNRWMKPQAYNKDRMVRNMDKALDKSEKEEALLFRVFFKDKKKLGLDDPYYIKGFVKDHISKDLSIPFHQIGPDEIMKWRDEGFERKSFKEWWKEPNEEELTRIENMEEGGSLRKDL